jgi:hypothetical protein
MARGVLGLRMILNICKQCGAKVFHSFNSDYCTDCIQKVVKFHAQIKKEDIFISGNCDYDAVKLKAVMERLEELSPACSSCGKKHCSLTLNKCDDCRKLEARVYDCLFCENQELLLDNRDNERWIYEEYCVCIACKFLCFWSPTPFTEFKHQIHGEILSLYCDKAGTYRFEKVKDSFSSLYYRGQSMLYLHYEEFQISLPDKGVQDLVRLVFSISAIERKVYGAKVFATIKDCCYYLKQIPGDSRTMDPKTYIWTIPQDKFDSLKKIYLTMQYINSESYFKKHDSLQDFVDGVKKHKLGDIPKAEEFFYSYGQPVAGGSLSKESIAAKLQGILAEALKTEIDLSKSTAIDLLKVYRKAALIYHPDRNGGDGSKMSELNMLWQMYKS